MSVSTEIADSSARQQIATALDRTMVVEAAAGTGKTTELVGRIVRLIEHGHGRIGEIVAVTFSEKAAGELKLRLREELEKARARYAAHTVEHDRLARAVYDFEEAHLSTIHGFCAELLRERPVEACVDPAFTVLTDSQAAVLLDEAFVGWFQEQLSAPGEGVRRSLRRPSRWRPGDSDEGGAEQRLRGAARELTEWRDHDTPWTRPAFARTPVIDALIAELATFAELTARPLKTADAFSVDTLPARRVHAEIARLQAVQSADYDGWEALLIALAEDRDFARARRGSGVAFAQGLTRPAAHVVHATLLEHLATFREHADADLAALLQQEMRGCLDRYEQAKKAAGALDFLDLLIEARNLVRDSLPVRHAFRTRFKVLLVDEFQDTDPLQAELLLLLASDDSGVLRPGALFIVGDPKQSIYRFRRADVTAYGRISAQLGAQGASHATLQTSFRSVPAIQSFVNAAFSPEMTGDARTGQATYVALLPRRSDHLAQPAVVALPLARPYGRRDVTLAALESEQPPAIGEFVKWLVSPECPWTVDAADPHDPARRISRPIVPSDVCLLFRRFLKYGADVTRPYVEALEARGVPHLLVGGKTFHEREEVDALRTALTAIEWPEDELSVYATLHGPLFAIGEEELLEYHALAHAFHPYRVPANLPPHLVPLSEALEMLRQLHATRNHRTVADTIGRLIEATRAHAGFILWRGGEQVLANVLHISDLARRYESEGGLSFRGFVDVLRDAADRSEAPEAPILEEGSEGVRLMTVHKAKGLEFPVVILADIGCKLSPDQASRHLDSPARLCAFRLGGFAPRELIDNSAVETSRDAAEGVRLAYVAATRARDLLVVPAVGDGTYQKGWLQPLWRALFPPVAMRQDPQPDPGCPPFAGKDTVLLRPEGQQPDASTVRPGAYDLADAASGSTYRVVWWDPRLIDHKAEDPRGLRRGDLISKDALPEHVAIDRARFDAWQAWRHEALAQGARPSTTVVTTSEWARSGEPPPAGIVVDAAAVTATAVPADGGRPSGRRFGTLVHALLAMAPLDASPRQLRDLAQVQSRLLGATDEERAAAATIVHRVLAHPLLVAARSAVAAGRVCRREAPVSVVMNGVLVDGQVDLAFDEGGGWVVVDFKTDAEIGIAEDVYRRQVALYTAAIARATGQPARGVLLRV